ncbi:MAG: hypothetical protein AAGB32_02795 [Pseudomonadota bacterium]
MNLARHDPDLEPLRDGTQKGDVRYFREQWWNAGKKHARDGFPYSAVFRHPENPQLFLTPYAYEYFKGVLPTEMPESSKVNRIVVATDLDAKFWYADHCGPPSNAFKAIMNEAYEEQGVVKGTDLWCFFDEAFVQNMRHTPRALFFNQQFSTALVVLSAIQSATYHLKEMAGVACLPEYGFDKGEIHDALMRHEWFHLSEDEHLNDLGIEIGGDDAAIEGIETPDLKQAWIDARIVGGFMWPFEGRQNGIPLIDPDFRKELKQQIQMNAVYEFCDAVFEEYFDAEAAAQMVSDIYYEIDRGTSLLPQKMQDYISEKFWEKGLNTRKEIPTAVDFKNWFCNGDDSEVAPYAWQYMTQSYMMKLQVSNANRPEFYAQMLSLSERLHPSHGGQAPNTKTKVHEYFRESLKRLLPDLPSTAEAFEPKWMSVQLPIVELRMGPYIG